MAGRRFRRIFFVVITATTAVIACSEIIAIMRRRGKPRSRHHDGTVEEYMACVQQTSTRTRATTSRSVSILSPTMTRRSEPFALCKLGIVIMRILIHCISVNAILHEIYISRC
jgi:hypothetical protein